MSLLVCVRCRGPRDGRLFWEQLLVRGDFAECSCGARYPVVDGIPVVFNNLAAFLESEGPVLLERQDLGEELREGLERGAGGPLERSRSLLATYRRSTEGPLQEWLREEGRNLQGRVLEGGCGLGVRAESVGMDHNFGLLRAAVCDEKVCGDLLDPPFGPSSFDGIILANVLDSCAQPAMVLAQADALLRPGGCLLLSCAFAYRSDITPPQHWLGEEQLLAGLQGQRSIGPVGLRYALERVEERDWPLWVSPRQRSVFRTLALRARKVDVSHRHVTSGG